MGRHREGGCRYEGCEHPKYVKRDNTEQPKHQQLTPHIAEGETNEELAHVTHLAKVRETYGHPHMTGHRSNLAGSIYAGCKKEKSINFFFATEIREVKTFGPQPTIMAIPRKGGEPYEVKADVLLAADGVKSALRVAMMKELGVDAAVKDTGQAAYRIMLRREEMAHDPELLELISSDRVTRWIGERRHLIAYPVSSHQIYNISSAQPDVNFAEAPSATYTTRGSKKQMLDVYGDFCPLVHRMLNLVPEGEVCEWKLRVHAPLPTWVHKSTALVGDACHPTLPHLNQGAAQAIEDAGVLSVVLSKLPDTSPESINKALKAYEKVRKERAELLVDLAAQSGRTLHLGEGEAKKERDALFAKAKEGGAVPDKWADADIQKMIYGHDCMRVAEEEFEGLFAKL